MTRFNLNPLLDATVEPEYFLVLMFPASISIRGSEEGFGGSDWISDVTGQQLVCLRCSSWQRQGRLGSVTVRTLDLRSRGRWFDSRSGRYQVVSTWMGDCLRTGKPSRYITNTKLNSAFHPSGVGESSIGLYGWGYGGARSPVSGGK